MLNQPAINELLDYVKIWKWELSIYIWVDVWKQILDVGATIKDSDLQTYLWTVDNNGYWFRQIEDVIINLISLWIDENNIFFWTENTGIYGHDVMNYFDDRIPNTYLLNSNLTCHARQYYAKSDFKSDNIDSIIIATTLRDLDSNNKLESINNPFNKWVWLWFVRRSFSKERSSLRILFRRLNRLRCDKSKLMTSINLSKERLFPELNWIFSIKHRASTEAILLDHFTREEILSMNKEEFINKYKSLASRWQRNIRVLNKVNEFYDKVTARWAKVSCSSLDKIMNQNVDSYILEEIKFKRQHYELIEHEMKIVQKKIASLLKILEQAWWYIPKFVWINDIEIWLILWELWFDVYQMSSKEFIWFVWWHPDNYTSWWWHMVKAPRLSSKKWIIKKFVYLWMYWFQLHNPSFRLYKKLLLTYYGISDEDWGSVISIKNRRKVEIKCWEKLLQIIHDWYKKRWWFSESRFLESTIYPLISRMKDSGLTNDSINEVIKDVYKDEHICNIIINQTKNGA